jgi:hypothetical protein
MASVDRIRRSVGGTCLAGVMLASIVFPIRVESPGVIAADGAVVQAHRELGAASGIARPAVEALDLICADSAKLVRGAFTAENNTWGKEALAGWSQCVGIGAGEAGGVLARWTWDWLDSGDKVKGYPAIVFGQKPGHPTTTSLLPRRLSAIGSASVSWNVDYARTGRGNLAFDIWLTSTANPATFAAPPIAHEIMIWLDAYGGMTPGGHLLESVTLDGLAYDLYVDENSRRGWRYVVFRSVAPQTGTGRIDLLAFTNFLVMRKLIAGDEFVASIELGNEVVSGTGDTRVSAYSVSIAGTSPN